MSYEFLIVTSWGVAQIARTMPTLVWALRCDPASRTYKCPPAPISSTRLKQAIRVTAGRNQS